MNKVQDQYETYPYPARNPADERKRLVTGSPSHPLELDHFLFAGKRDWSRPLRILSAGGGTGDGLIQLTAMLQAAGRPYKATYVDLSKTARAIAEERAKIRKLDQITFVTGSLLEAGDLGQFDYIDCCGVLHHLPDPQAGFDALAAALAPGGGMGLMVYATYGRTGVYPLQQAFGALWPDAAPADRLSGAKAVMDKLPDGHPFNCNPHLVDHRQSDAGFYDLLLHSQDRAYDVAELAQTLARAGLRVVNFTQPALYDLARLVPGDVPAHLSQVDRWAVAEKLRGTIKTHVAYVAHIDGSARQAQPSDRSLVPHLKGVPADKLAARVAAQGSVPIAQGADKLVEPLEAACAPLVAAINSQRNLAQIAQTAGVDPISFGALWAKVDRVLGDWGVMLYGQPVRARK